MSDPSAGDHGLCAACPALVRNLSASAHNAVSAFESAAAGYGDWSRAHRKIAALKDAVAAFRPTVDMHFAQHGKPCGCPA